MSVGLAETDRLVAWSDAHLPGSGELLVRRMTAGASNEVFELVRSGRRWVLRRPAPSSRAPQENLLREFRLLTALDATDVPHPRAVVACDDPQVIGAMFYVMEYVDGFTPTRDLPAPFAEDEGARHGLGLGLLDGLTTLGAVDWAAIGLDGFGRPDGFLERQVSRWLAFDASARTRPLEHLDTVAGWLDANRPPGGTPAIMHGDYQFANAMFRHDTPARLAAIIDWEQSTVGDPLVDLGWLLALWDEPGEEPIRGAGEERVSALAGFPTRAELTERYARRTGRDLDHLGWYEVFALFKLALVLEGAYTRHASGRSDNPAHARLERMVPSLLASAARLVAAGGHPR